MKKYWAPCSSMVLLFLLIGMVAGCSSRPEQETSASKYPAKPITFIVPYAAGGTADMMARALEKVAPKYFQQPLIVTNIPGGASAVGMTELAGSKPDGYTIGYVSLGVFLQPLYGQTRYHFPTALDPLVQVMSTPAVAIVNANQPWNTLQDLIQYAKNHPGEVKFGHSGLGSGTHVAGEYFAKEAGIDIKQVPFKGEAEALAAVLGGHIQLLFANPPSVQEYVKSGKIRVLAVAADQRLSDSVFAGMPTFKEQGLDVVHYSWHAIGAPKGIPDAERKQLLAGLEQMVNDPDFKNNMENLGMTIEYLGNKEFSQKWLYDNERLTRMVKETGIAEKIAAQKQ